MDLKNEVRFSFIIRHRIDNATLETQEVLRFDDEDGREYMWDGIELYRLKLLKGKG